MSNNYYLVCKPKKEALKLGVRYHMLTHGEHWGPRVRLVRRDVCDVVDRWLQEIQAPTAVVWVEGEDDEPWWNDLWDCPEPGWRISDIDWDKDDRARSIDWGERVGGFQDVVSIPDLSGGQAYDVHLIDIPKSKVFTFRNVPGAPQEAASDWLKGIDPALALKVKLMGGGDRVLIDREALREKLASLEHEQWAHWTRYMLSQLEELFEFCAERHFEPEAVGHIRRWQRQIETPYADLSEAEKNSDREWADKVLALLEES